MTNTRYAEMPPALANRYAAEVDAERQTLPATITLDQFEALLVRALAPIKEKLDVHDKAMRLLAVENTKLRFRLDGIEARLARLETDVAPKPAADYDDPLTRIKFQFFQNSPQQGKARFRLKLEFFRGAQKVQVGKPTYINMHKPGAGMRKSQGGRLDHLIKQGVKFVGRKGPFEVSINTDDTVTLVFKQQSYSVSQPKTTPAKADPGAYELLWNWNAAADGDLSSARDGA